MNTIMSIDLNLILESDKNATALTTLSGEPLGLLSSGRDL